MQPVMVRNCLLGAAVPLHRLGDLPVPLLPVPANACLNLRSTRSLRRFKGHAMLREYQWRRAKSNIKDPATGRARSGKHDEKRYDIRGREPGEGLNLMHS